VFLFEQIEQARNFGAYAELPSYIGSNLNPVFEIRPYQDSAFCNFITYFENEHIRKDPTNVLFHMATGSGKTLIMAGLMIYLYKKGYRDFLFFVNLDNIVNKTKDNFLNSKSSKYLFADNLNIDGNIIKIREVQNFQDRNNDSINICFTTTQGLHSDMWNVKENAISIDDFKERKIVLISDEAHHLNADTKRGKTGREDDATKSWEYTVNRIFNTNKFNLLLEFTATCDLSNSFIKAQYEDKIIYDYPLKRFREDKFSKEVNTLQADIERLDRAIQAIMLSQYRLKVFQHAGLSIKPVVLFKAATIADSKSFVDIFSKAVRNLNSDALQRIAGLTEHKTLKAMYKYFNDNGITFEMLVQELKDDFSPERCISVNDEDEAEQKQIIVNTLEDKDNPYRAVFEVKKLDEGWDVLNLFDIVRLYETRQSGQGKLSPTTIQEAQLIGRGARYCPFAVSAEQNKYQRKYDDDLDNPLRVCEELYYHCQYDSRYIAELTAALKQTGIIPNNKVEQEYKIKEEFIDESLYQTGLVFFNQREEKGRDGVYSLLPSVKDKEYSVSLFSGKTQVDIVLADSNTVNPGVDVKTFTKRITFKEIANLNYASVHKALCKYDAYRFSTLKSYFPHLKSTREFVTDGAYLGDIKVVIESPGNEPTIEHFYNSCINVLGKIANEISTINITYGGTKEFKSKHLHEIFKNTRVTYSDPHDGGVGISQNDSSVPKKWKIDLSKEDWFVYTDNFGTSEEKAFVAYFQTFVDSLKGKYDKVYLVRNERLLKLYSFSDGEGFEPDYLLFLHKNKGDGFEQYQIFIEPKGAHLISDDIWKEEFLLKLEKEAIAVKTFVDDNEYHIWGFHFFNQDQRSKEFSEDMSKL